MNTPSDIRPAGISRTRPFYWSVRRELWENRSIYVAPLVVAAVVLFAFSISLAGFVRRFREVSALAPERQEAAHAMPYHFAGAAILLTTLIVGVFYCLGALHGERRDRSILFWKSLPVSDWITVLAKAGVPVVVLPLIGFAAVSATQLIMLRLSTGILLLNGLDPSPLRIAVRLLPMSAALLYGLVTMALWHAPIYGWLLLVSGWARRAVFLWAVGPPFALCVIEKIAFNSGHLAAWLIYRLTGSFTAAFATLEPGMGVADKLPQIDPLKFLGSSGLWIGLVVAAGFLVSAVWLRRRGEPI